MEDDLRQNLLSCAHAFCRARGLEMSTLGRKAAGEWRFFSRLSGDRTFTIKKYDEVMAWFSTEWPDDLDWPQGVPRPEVAAKAAA